MNAIESTFGGRLGRSQTMFEYLSGFNGYQAPRPEDSLESLNSFIGVLLLKNTTVAQTSQALRNAVYNRQQLFWNTGSGMEKIVQNVLLMTKAFYGNSSLEVKSVQTIVKKMRGVKKPSTVTTAEGETLQKTVSQSHRSYNSLTNYFNELIVTLQSFEGYAPTIDEVSIDGLTARFQLLNESNTLVNTNKISNSLAIEERLVAFEDLHIRFLRIRSYTRARYGLSSKEFGLISKLKL